MKVIISSLCFSVAVVAVPLCAASVSQADDATGRKETVALTPAEVGKVYAEYRETVQARLDAGRSFLVVPENAHLARRLAKSVEQNKAFFRDKVVSDFFIVEFVLEGSDLYDKHESQFDRILQLHSNTDRCFPARRELWWKILSGGQAGPPPGSGVLPADPTGQKAEEPYENRPGADKRVSAILVALKDEDREIPSKAVRNLAETDPAAFIELLKAVPDQEHEVIVRASRAVMTIGPEAKVAVPALTKALRDGDEDLKVAAAYALRFIGPEAKAAVPELMELLKDKENKTWAIDALASIGPEAAAAAPQLMQILCDRSEKNENVRRGAALALVELGPAGVRSLAEALEKEDAQTRWIAVLGLACARPPAVTELVKALDDKEPRVRRHAIGWLGHIGPAAKEAIPELEKRLGDDAPSVREAAAKALEMIRTKP